MEQLNVKEATQLFSLNAFEQDSVPSSYICESTKTVIDYAQGNPLALIVLGRRLFRKSEEDWRSALRSLRQIPHNDIYDVLKTSYDAVLPETQSIFLDIACFYGMISRDFANKLWDAQLWDAHGITTLIDLALVSVDNCKLEVHNLLQEMAQRIVVHESKQPVKRSRHWNADEICNMLEANEGTDAIEVISLDMSKAREIRIQPDTFSKMRYLRMLHIYSNDRNKLLFSALKSFPGGLRYLCWEYFPKKTLPSNFNPTNLVVLELPNSKVKKLWEGTQNLVSLRKIDLWDSKHLISIPDLSKATNIEDIDLCGCENLEEVDPSIEHLINLKILDLRNCLKLRTLPRRLNSNVLQQLYLYNCPRIEGLPDFEWNGLQLLRLDCSGIKDAESNSRLCSALSNNFCGMKSLEVFVLCNCSILESFPEIMEPMNYLKSFELIDCTRLKSLPDRIFYNLKSLELLELSGSAIKELPSSIIDLKNLWKLQLDDCKYLESLPTSINTLSKLTFLYLNSCVSLRSLQELPPNLYKLEANHCKSLETIGELPPNFYLLETNHCESLETIGFGESPRQLQCANCPRLNLNIKELNIKLKSEHRFRRCHILYSGSEIPEWFIHQSRGSSITLHSPLYLDQLCYVAFCVVFEITKPLEDNIFRFKIRSNFSEFESLGIMFDQKLLGTDLVLIWSNSILVQYLNQNLSSLDFYCSIFDFFSPGAPCYSCLVKSCGFYY